MLRERLTMTLRESLKAKEACTASTVRLILAVVKERDISARAKNNVEQVGDEQIQDLLQIMVKQRRESIAMYENGGRKDLAEREAKEIVVIQRFLPVQMNEAAIKVAVTEIIAETGASGLKEMGVVMTALRKRHPGAMDFSKAGALARAALS